MAPSYSLVAGKRLSHELHEAVLLVLVVVALALAGQLDRGVEEEGAEDVEDPAELLDGGGAEPDEQATQDDRDDDADHQCGLLELLGHGELRHDQEEDEQVVDRQRVLGQPAGVELAGQLGPREVPHPEPEEDGRTDVPTQGQARLAVGRAVRVAGDPHDVEGEERGGDADRHPPDPRVQVEGTRWRSAGSRGSPGGLYRGANALDEPKRCDPRLLGMASMLDDLSLLTSLHRQVVVESGRADLLDITDELEARCRADDPDAPTELVAALDPDTTERIARLLTVHLHLTNLAEERQRARSLRREDGEFGGGTDTGDIGPAVAACGPDARARIERMRIHPVLTAHPTEARRRAVATALRRIAASLDAHDDSEWAARSAPARRRMLEDIDILQRTSALRITRPEPRRRGQHRAHGLRPVALHARAALLARRRERAGRHRPGGHRCPRSFGSARGSGATATATPSSPRRSPARRWRPTPTTHCAACRRQRADRPDAHGGRARPPAPPALLASLANDPRLAAPTRAKELATSAPTSRTGRS